VAGSPWSWASSENVAHPFLEAYCGTTYYLDAPVEYLLDCPLWCLPLSIYLDTTRSPAYTILFSSEIKCSLATSQYMVGVHVDDYVDPAATDSEATGRKSIADSSVLGNIVSIKKDGTRLLESGNPAIVSQIVSYLNTPDRTERLFFAYSHSTRPQCLPVLGNNVAEGGQNELLN